MSCAVGDFAYLRETSATVAPPTNPDNAKASKCGCARLCSNIHYPNRRDLNWLTSLLRLHQIRIYLIPRWRCENWRLRILELHLVEDNPFLQPTPPSIEPFAFSNPAYEPPPDDLIVYVPKGTLDEYKKAFSFAGANFNDAREMEPGVEFIDANDNAEGVNYNLNGFRVNHNDGMHGIFIRRQGDKVEKVAL